MRLRLAGRIGSERRKPGYAGLLLIAAILFSVGCAEYDSNVGSSVIGNGFEGTLKQTTIPVLRDTTRVIGDYYKSSVVSAPLGKQDGFVSEILLRYSEFSALGDTLLDVSDARIELHGNSFIDSAAVTDFTPWRAVVNRIDGYFNPITIRYGDELELTPLDTLEFGTAESMDSLEIVLDAETIFRWVNDTLDYGLLIRPLEEDNPQFLKKYFLRPSDTSQAPTLDLTVTIQEDETIYPDSVLSIGFAYGFFMTEDQALEDDTRLIVSTSYVRQPFFYGDFSQFSASSVSINRVLLVLKADTLWNHRLGELGSYTWNYLTSDWFESDLDSVSIGSELSTSAYGEYAIADTVDSIQVDVTPICRTWVALPEENFGVLLRSPLQGNIMRREAFYSSKETDPALRPYFVITYTEYDEP